LVATDERIFSYRHPLPTDKKMDRYAMVVLCGRRWGLVCSVTRLVHFGRLPEEVRRKANAVAFIDATFLHQTTPGKLLGDIFQSAVQAYADQGYGGEWKLHHQGGPAGYEPREFLGLPGSQDQVFAGQTYAWNPSITGAKSEDTILIGDSGNEVLSEIPGWPLIQVEIGAEVYKRPDILEILA
jgi:antitoxin VapB